MPAPAPLPAAPAQPAIGKMQQYLPLLLIIIIFLLLIVIIALVFTSKR
jgi:hypothetical protein